MTEILICWICGKALALEERHSEEVGRAVHANCYMAVVLSERRTSFIPKKKAS
jgi:hypothetical protein